MTAKEIAQKTGRSEAWIYILARKLGRLPTIQEVEERKGKNGRPPKYRTEDK